MKTCNLLSLLSLLAPISAHTIFQRLEVDGADQGQLVGVRAPSSNNPVQDVSSSSIACNTGLYSPVSTKVVTIPAGSTVGSWWQHLIGGPQGGSDPDNPIAASHKGPVMVYLAEVSDAGTAGTSGLSWFKIYQDGVDSSGKWAVDKMIEGDGWYDFTVPSCVKPGQYLMRVEIVALHSAYSQGQAQFYMSCANVEITGSGTKTGTTVSFPGAYSASDPGILINIYDANGNPTNGGKEYDFPGPEVMTC